MPPHLSGSGQNHISGTLGDASWRAVNSWTQRARPIVAERWPFQMSIRGSPARLRTTPVLPMSAAKTSLSHWGLKVSRWPNPWLWAASRRSARTSAPLSDTWPISAKPVRTSAVRIASTDLLAASDIAQAQRSPSLNGCARHRSMNGIMRPSAPALALKFAETWQIRRLAASASSASCTGARSKRYCLQRPNFVIPAKAKRRAGTQGFSGQYFWVPGLAISSPGMTKFFTRRKGPKTKSADGEHPR